MSHKKLTLDCLLETHYILMLGAVDQKGNPILNGIRKFGVNSGVDNYMCHEDAEDHLQHLVVW